MQASELALALGSALRLRRFTITHADLTDNDTSQTINLYTLTKGSAVLGVRIKHSTAFSGGSVSALTVSIGAAAGSATTFASAFDIFQAAAVTTFQMTNSFNAATYADDTVQAVFTSTTDNLVNLTAGSVDIDILTVDVSTPL